jgi:hypothetical protein
MLVACRDNMQFGIGENEVFSGKTIVSSLGKDFAILSMLTDFLINQPASPYTMTTELEVLYRKILKQPFPTNVEWNDMLQV